MSTWLARVNTHEYFSAFRFEASPLYVASSSAMGTSFPRFVFLETDRLLQHLFPAVVSLLQGELVPFPEVTGNVRKRMHDVLENSLRWVVVRHTTFGSYLGDLPQFSWRVSIS